MPRGNDENPTNSSMPAPPAARPVDPVVAARDPHVHRLVQRYERRLAAELSDLGAMNELNPDRLNKLYNIAATRAAGKGTEITHQDQRMLVIAGRKDPETGEIRDQKARDLLVNSHQKTVSKLMVKHLRRNPSLNEDELLNEGLAGIAHAIDKYTDDKGANFHTYAKLWANKFMQVAIGNATTTYKSQNVREDVITARAIANKLASQNFGIKPTEEQLIDELIKQGKAKDTEASRDKWSDTIRLMDEKVCSLDVRFGDEEEGRSLVDMMADDDVRTHASEAMQSSMTSQLLNEHLARLDTTEREVVKRTLGLEGYESANLAEVAEQMGSKRSTISATNQRALAKLRDSLAAEGITAEDFASVL